MFGDDQSIDYGENNENVQVFACVHPPFMQSCKVAATSQWFYSQNFYKM